MPAVPSGSTPVWALAPAEIRARCRDFLRAQLAAAGCERLVVGLSGGIDSAVAAALATEALGAANVRGIMMPYATSSAASLTDAQAVATCLGLAVEKVDITPMADAFLAGVPAEARVRRGNVMARCRMIVLYDRSAQDQALVLGTGNRTEGLLGYTTMYGDNACALNPIGQLYKTEVRLLAADFGLPQAVLDKAPSADLWAGQSDEDELGVSYAEVDRLLHHLVDEGLGERQLAALGFAPQLVARIAARVRAMAFKRRLPPVAAMPGRPDPDLAAAAGGGAAT
ncbi:MAG: NAD+ synthase [bacterium]|nr:NAD+ synthase [bacterium]